MVATSSASRCQMTELIRTNDMILLSFATACLKSEGIPALVADQHMAGIEGAIGAFPRRLCVSAGDEARARAILAEAGLAAHLLDESDVRP